MLVKKDEVGRTALHLASIRGHLDIVKYLVEECHCDVSEKDKHGGSVLEAAGDYPNLVSYLKKCARTEGN